MCCTMGPQTGSRTIVIWEGDSKSDPRGDSKDGFGDACDGNGYGRYVWGSSLVSFDPRGDGKSEVVSDVEVTGPDQRGFLLVAETN